MLLDKLGAVFQVFGYCLLESLMLFMYLFTYCVGPEGDTEKRR